MRIKSNVLFIVLLVYCCTSCGDKMSEMRYYSDEDANKYILYESGPETFGHATALVNGHSWRASAYYAPDISDPDSLYHIAFETDETKFYFAREGLSISPIAKFNTGKYTLVRSSDIAQLSDLPEGQLIFGMVVLQDDGDVFAANFELDPDYDSWIEITDWDEQTGLMIGRFEIAVLLESQAMGFDNPSKILFESGRFKCVEQE